MSSMAFAQKSFQARPPEKGSFPLDHQGECKSYMTKYMRCLRTSKMNNAECRDSAKDYLDCRMQKNLMAKEEWKKLGYADQSQDDTTEAKST